VRDRGIRLVTARQACFTLAAALLVAACGRTITPEPTTEGAAVATAAAGQSSTPTRRLTATAPILPPADTPTPTLTPTPIIHVIASGDTLYSIAFEYGVNPDALQAANGIEDPRFLSIGQELIIPTGEEDDSGTSNLLLPTPTPAPIAVQGVGFYDTPVGSLWSLGEVVNTTGETLTNVQVRVMLFDAQGALVAEEDAFAAAELIASGERSPFGILFTSPPAGWANSQVSIVRGEAAGELVSSFVPVTLSDVAAVPAEDQLQVSGNVVNGSGGQSLGSAIVIVTTYDGEGLVTGFRQRTFEPEGPVAPGGSVPFSLRLSYHGSEPADYHVMALGRPPAG
jgi:LysM repeat protein